MQIYSINLIDPVGLIFEYAQDSKPFRLVNENGRNKMFLL